MALLPVAFWVGRVRDGVAMTEHRPSPIAESASSAIDSDVEVGRAADGELATLTKRLRAKWAQRRREQREFKAWLEITAKPLW
ncbi:MAG: hypothetical protein ACLP3C_24755 [Mycobacterium sp.]|uniref:hypothetical protein n=1 Tax=Mycobacterium sp. TaxID=1785 RepID=UPI003C55F83D